MFPADVDIPEWPAVFVHEGFHVFQIRFWAETSFEDQEKYDLDERNFVLAMLEDAALIDAYQSSGDDSTEALRRFLALRATRLAEFPTTALDLQQESLEGTAEWFEWVHTGRDEVDDPWANPTSGDLSDQMQFARESASAFGGVAPLQRFYHSGATQLALLERLGVDWQPRLEQGAAPSELLADLVAVDAADFERLVEEARQAYDPSGELAAVAQVWLEAEPSEDLDEAPSFADAPASVIACLAEYGLSAEQIDADPTLLTPEVDQACVAGFREQVFACIADAGFDIETVDFDSPPAEVAACFE